MQREKRCQAYANIHKLGCFRQLRAVFKSFGALIRMCLFTTFTFCLFLRSLFFALSLSLECPLCVFPFGECTSRLLNSNVFLFLCVSIPCCFVHAYRMLFEVHFDFSDGDDEYNLHFRAHLFNSRASQRLCMLLVAIYDAMQLHRRRFIISHIK